ncbi:MAG: 50S ribosomal protein L21 [Rhodospirillales bacterium]|nr:50S ribosomal protein L21 [Rhodospirillales bacterium]
MYAVIRTGGRQYRVAKNDRLVVERLAGEPGELVEFRDVLMIGAPGQVPTIGAPLVDKAAVFAELLEQTRGEKILIFKKRRRANYRRKRGHRQLLTVLRVVEVSATGEKPAFQPTPKRELKPKAVAADGEAADGEAKPKKKAKKAAESPREIKRAKAAEKSKAKEKAKAESKARKKKSKE